MKLIYNTFYNEPQDFKLQQTNQCISSDTTKHSSNHLNISHFYC